MVVLIVERVSPSIRGLLTRWLLEVQTGVYVGTPSAMVRDRLWMEVCRRVREGACVLVHTTNTEQGFVVWSYGLRDREVVDFEGLTLVRVKKRETLRSAEPGGR